MPPSLVQPLLSTHPEYGHHPKDVLSFYDFISLIREEEDYFEGEQYNTKLMITRLRKIFYDKWGWNTQLIRKAAMIKGRYKVKIVDCSGLTLSERSELSRVKRYHDNEYRPKCRAVTYRRNDRVYGDSRAGDVPFIYKYDHQDVCLLDGFHCDLAHVLAGLDALNYPQPVSPLPDFLSCLHPYFPYADSNADVTTWLGDIATTAADFLFFYLRENRPLTDKEKQIFIDINASASDMLGNIDAFVINYFYNTTTTKGRRLSEMFVEYYGNSATGTSFRRRRFNVFCECVGLRDWNGNCFKNENEWLSYYSVQLRSTTAFMVFSSADGLGRIRLPRRIMKREYEKIIEVDMLMNLFLAALKKLLH